MLVMLQFNPKAQGIESFDRQLILIRNLSPKVHSIFYAVLIEGVVLLFSTRIRAGMCGKWIVFADEIAPNKFLDRVVKPK